MAPQKGPEIVATVTDDLTLFWAIPRLVESKLREIGPGQRVRVDIKRFRKKRTNTQNSYLWAGVYPVIVRYIKDTTGQEFTAEDLHERYKRRFLGYEQCEIEGMGDIIKTKSSTELDTKEFWDKFIEHICREWAELGLYIPLPEKRA